MFSSRRIRRSPKGHFEVRLPDVEREVLESAATQLRDLLLGGTGAELNPSLRRLFPTAYVDDAKREAEYQSLVQDDLLERRLAAIDVVISTAGASRLDEEQLLTWMSVVNDVRLVLGTYLDVSEDADLEPDPDDPSAPAVAVYLYLGVLLEVIIAALSP